MLDKIIAVGVGGFIGSVLRYVTVLGSQHLYPKDLIPIGTLIVNIVGCFLIGFIHSWDAGSGLSDRAKALMVTGFLGGLTTFSAFGYETFMLIKVEKMPLALINIGCQIILGLFAVWLGSLFYKLFI